MFTLSTRAFRAVLVVVALVGLVIIGHRVAEAGCSKYKEIDVGAKRKKVLRMGRPERTFRGKVLTSKKRFPTRARSEGAYISKIRKQRKSKFWEDKKEKQWKVYFMAFFRKPHDDMEVVIKLWDNSSGVKRMVSSFEQFVDRCMTSYASNMILKREDFGVNKQIVITVEGSRGGGVLATGKFKIFGEGEKFKGKVDFSDDEKPKNKPAEKKVEETAPEDDLPPEEDPYADAPLDLDNDSSLKGPDLDAREDDNGVKPPPEQHKSKGCGGCRTSGPTGHAGGLLLFGLVLGLGRWRRRERNA